MSRLTQDQEDDLRGFFCGALEVAVGCRSALGPALDRARRSGNRQARHFDDDDGRPTVFMSELPHNDAEDRLIDAIALIARQRLIRTALATLTRSQAQVLRAVFSPIPEQLVLGLVSAFGDRETAAVALLDVAVDAPGASRRPVLRALVDRAKGDKRKKQGASEKARAELEERRLAAKLAIRSSVDVYVAALRSVQCQAREAKRRRFEALLERARGGAR